MTATRSLFLRYGYRRTSVDDIAREAGVAKATLYLHFDGKDDMFRTMIRHFRAVMDARCDDAEASSGPVQVRIVGLLYARYGTALEWFGDAAHISELKAFVAENPIGPLDETSPAFHDRLRRLLREAIDRGELDPGRQSVTLQEVAQSLLFAADGAKRMQKNGAEGLRRALEAVTTLVLAGLRPVATARPPGGGQGRS